MFDSFEESLLEYAVSLQPEQLMFYQIKQDRYLFEKPISGQLFFAFEGRYAKIPDATREILQLRLTPLMWTELASDDFPPHTIWYQKQRNQSWANSFQLSVDHSRQTVRFGPSGNLMISETELRGLGFGTFAWRILIMWAKRKFPDYKVYKIELSPVDATPDNIYRRNHFFQKHGFRPVFDDAANESGWFYCDRVIDLTEADKSPEWNGKNSIEMAAGLLRDKIDIQNQVRTIQSNTRNWIEAYRQVLIEKRRLKITSLLLFLISLSALAMLIGLHIFKN